MKTCVTATRNLSFLPLLTGRNVYTITLQLCSTLIPAPFLMAFSMTSSKTYFNSFTGKDPRNKRLSPKLLTTVFVLLFFLSVPFALAESSGDFCKAIKEIIHNGRVDFKPIHGKLDLVSEEYFGTLTPPGLEECFAWLNGQAYHCRTPGGLNSEELAKTYETYNKTLRQCLPERWETSERNAGRANAGRFMTYRSDSNFVSLRIGERSQRQGWYLDFYFKR